MNNTNKQIKDLRKLISDKELQYDIAAQEVGIFAHVNFLSLSLKEQKTLYGILLSDKGKVELK